MKYFIILTVCLFSTLYPFAGHITANTTFAQDTIITGDVWIDPGVTLTIMPGVTIYVTKLDQNEDGIGDVNIFIEGRLVSQGMEGQRVTFTSNEENPAPQDWAGFVYTTDEDGELSTMSHTDIYYTHEAFYINGRNVTFNNCRIAHASSYGVKIESTIYTTSFNVTTIEDCGGYGLRIENGTLLINDLDIMNNGDYGFYAGNASVVTLSTATIFGNNGYGMHLEDSVVIDAEDLNVSSNTGTGLEITDNVTGEFSNSRFISNGVHGSEISSASPSFYNCRISNNGEDGVQVKDGSEALFDFCTVSENDNNGFYYSTSSNGTVSNSEIIDNGVYGVKIWGNSFPTFNFNHIYGNQGDENIEDFEVFTNNDHSDPNSWFPRYVRTITTYRNIGYANDSHCAPDNNGGSCNGHNQDYYDGSFNQYLNCGGESLFSYSGTIDSYGCGTGNQCYYDCGYNYQHLCFDGLNYTSGTTVTYTPYVWTENFSDFNIYSSAPSGMTNSFTIQSYTYSSLSPGFYQVTINNSAGTFIDFQNNWWNTINDVDDLVYQLNAGTTGYEVILTEPVDPVGVDLENLNPSITLLTPTEMELDPQSITLTWSDYDLDNDADISLYYDTGLDGNGTLIVSGLNEDDSEDSYTWGFSDTPYDLYNLYAVIDDGHGGVDTSYAPGQVMVGPLTVQVATDIIGVPGTEVEVPVEVINTIGYYGIISFQFTLSYNSAMIEATSISVDDCLSESWTVFSNLNNEGQVTVTGFPGDGTPLNNPGSADLVKIKFSIFEGLDDYSTSPLNFADFTFNDANPEPVVNDGILTIIEQYYIDGNAVYYKQYADQDIPIENLELSLTGESLNEPYVVSTDSDGNYAFPVFLAGDYSVTASYAGEVGEMVVTPYDASLTAQYSIFLYAFDSHQQAAADVNLDGNATTYDAALIAQYSVGLIDEFAAGTWIIDPDERDYSLLDNFSNQDYQLIVVGDPSGNWGQFNMLGRNKLNNVHSLSISSKYRYVTVPININVPFKSIYIDVQYPEQGYEFISMKKDDALDQLNGSVNNQPGRYRLSAFSMEDIIVDGEAYTLVFKQPMYKKHKMNTLEIFNVTIMVDEIILNGDDSDNVSSVLARGSDELSQIPFQFGLSDSYPNPFNPITSFELSIAEEKQVDVIVYDLSGKQVDVLYSGTRAPGYYNISWQADRHSSGVYFVRLLAEGNLLDTKKITLLK